MSTPGSRAVGHTVSPVVVYLLVGASVLSGLATLLVPDLLTGPAVMNGSAKGTALVVVLGGAPVLAVAHARARSGSVVGLALAVGAAAYLVYNGVLLVLATPFNRAFLLYEAMLGLGVWTLVGLAHELWARTRGLRPPAQRRAAGFILAVVVLNLAAWLAALVPALLSDHPRSMLAGTGLTTNPVYVQDLAFWLPAVAWIAIGMWRAHGPRTALGAAALCYWLLESAGVAVDQWWGHHADTASAVASADVVPIFVVVGACTVCALVSVSKVLATASPSSGEEARPPLTIVGGSGRG
jgi:hypothetical protein